MRSIRAAYLLALTLPALAESLPPHQPILSVELGFGVGIVITETERDSADSILRISRSYKYQGVPGAAWGMPQNFFLLCALNLLGAERKFNQAKFTYMVMDADGLREFRKDENLGDIGPEQLHVKVHWQSGSNEGVQSLLKQHVMPLGGQLDLTCQKFKSQGALSK